MGPLGTEGDAKFQIHEWLRVTEVAARLAAIQIFSMSELPIPPPPQRKHWGDSNAIFKTRNKYGREKSFKSSSPELVLRPL